MTPPAHHLPSATWLSWTYGDPQTSHLLLDSQFVRMEAQSRPANTYAARIASLDVSASSAGCSQYLRQLCAEEVQH